MMPYEERHYSVPRSHRCPYQYEVRGSDAWLLADAVFTVLAAAVTIVVLIVRHPFMVLTVALVAKLVGALAGWW
jgi:hypothetical protein